MASKKERLVKWTELFDPRVYPLKAVNQAVRDYATLGKFTVRPKAGKIEVKAVIAAESDFDFREEFANYVLGMVFKCK